MCHHLRNGRTIRANMCQCEPVPPTPIGPSQTESAIVIFFVLDVRPVDVDNICALLLRVSKESPVLGSEIGISIK